MNENLECEISELSNLLNFTDNYSFILKINKIIDVLKDYSKEEIIDYLDRLLKNKKNILSINEFSKFKQGIFFIKLCIFLHFDADNQNDFIEDCFKEINKENNN